MVDPTTVMRVCERATSRMESETGPWGCSGSSSSSTGLSGSAGGVGDAVGDGLVKTVAFELKTSVLELALGIRAVGAMNPDLTFSAATSNSSS